MVPHHSHHYPTHSADEGVGGVGEEAANVGGTAGGKSLVAVAAAAVVDAGKYALCGNRGPISLQKSLSVLDPPAVPAGCDGQRYLHCHLGWVRTLGGLHPHPHSAESLHGNAHKSQQVVENDEVVVLRMADAV